MMTNEEMQKEFEETLKEKYGSKDEEFEAKIVEEFEKAAKDLGKEYDERIEKMKKEHNFDLLVTSLGGAVIAASLYILGKRIGVETVFKKLNILDVKEPVYTTFEKINDGGVRVNFVDKAGKSCMINNVGFFTKDDFGNFLGYLMDAGIKGFDCDVITASTLSKKVNFLDNSSK